MKLKLASLLLAAVFFAAFAGAEVDRSTPENTVKSFMQALAESNYGNLLSCVKGAKRHEAMAQMMGMRKGEVPKIDLLISDVKIDGDKATCFVTVKPARNNAVEKAMNDTLSLEKTGDVWLIVAPAGEPDEQHFLNYVACMVVRPDEIFASVKVSAKEAACLSNVRQIATGFLIYATDNDDVFKVKSDAWKKAIMPYVKNDRIFHCPADSSGIVSYSINPALVGRSLVSYDDPASIVLLYEGSKGKLNFRHGGFAAVAFADGHAKMVSVAEAKKLRWKP